MIRTGIAAIGAGWLLHIASPVAAPAQGHDIVIANGRVVDPESGLDAVRHVGIRGDCIVAVSQRPLTGRRTIDNRGMVVARGSTSSCNGTCGSARRGGPRGAIEIGRASCRGRGKTLWGT